MAKRRRRLKRGGPRKQYTSTAQLRMLNLQRKDVFKYHMQQALERSDMQEEHIQTFMANVLSKSSQGSIDDAKDYIGSVVEKGLLEGDTADRIMRLLDKYSTHR